MPPSRSQGKAKERSSKKITEAVALDVQMSSPENAEIIDNDDYALRRQRNNASVNKTRQKKRQEEITTQKRVQQLKAENSQLERKLETMQRELELLKEMVVTCASGKK